MKKTIYILFAALLAGITLASCNEDETYAEQKEKERAAVMAFIKRQPITLCNNNGDTLLHLTAINPISIQQFEAQDSTTDVSKNEFVFFNNTGVYMQIVRKGTGQPLNSGERKRILCRYWEYNILGDSLQTSNLSTYWSTNPEIINASNTAGTISGTFDTSVNGGGPMYLVYKDVTVPKGWLVPLTYVKIGRQTQPDEGIAKVRLIVPHSSGHKYATQGVYPCFYEITYQEMRD